jgi:Reverse transcriptase (RNA-dependent DNA polymerase)
MPETIKQLTPIETRLTDEEFCSEWHKCREYTSCGKSGIHFGHFKASCQNVKSREVDWILAEIPLRTGYSMSRWQVGIDVMIPKKNNHRAASLRTIVLMETDFNFLNKIIGKRVMRHAEQMDTIAPEQYGSRKNKSALLHATNKQLTLDITKQSRINSALMVLDAKSCYDRISPPIASLALR